MGVDVCPWVAPWAHVMPGGAGQWHEYLDFAMRLGRAEPSGLTPIRGQLHRFVHSAMALLSHTCAYLSDSGSTALLGGSMLGLTARNGCLHRVDAHHRAYILSQPGMVRRMLAASMATAMEHIHVRAPMAMYYQSKFALGVITFRMATCAMQYPSIAMVLEILAPPPECRCPNI